MKKIVLALFVAVVSVACGSDSTAPATDPGPTVVTVDIVPNLGGLGVGGSAQLHLVGFDSVGHQVSRALKPAWSSSNPASISVDSTGLVAARAPGGAVIRGTLQERGRAITDSVSVGIVVPI
jgi:hypothetical protein